MGEGEAREVGDLPTDWGNWDRLPWRGITSAGPGVLEFGDEKLGDRASSQTEGMAMEKADPSPGPGPGKSGEHTVTTWGRVNRVHGHPD